MTKRTNWPITLSIKEGTLTNEQKLIELAAVGIHQVELSFGWKAQLKKFDFRTRYNEAFSLAEKHGIKITSLHLPFGGFDEIDPSRPETIDAFLQLQKELLVAAKAINIPIAVVHPSGEPYTEEERPERMRHAVSTIRTLCEYAKSLGIELALENLPRTCLCRGKDEMLEFLREIPDLKVCYDMNHCLNEDNLEYLKAVANRVITIHASDYDGIDERHWLPGKGINNWEAIISTLEEANYSGRFVFELVDDADTFAEIRACYDKLIN